MTYAEALLEFCREIGIDIARAMKAETPDEYRLKTRLSALRLKDITGVLERLIQVFGRGLTLAVGIPDIPPLLEIKTGQVADLGLGLQRIAGEVDETELQLDLTVDKSAILARVSPTLPRNCRLASRR